MLTNWGAESFENSIFHEFLIQGGPLGAEHPPGLLGTNFGANFVPEKASEETK